ncbi:MAG: DUF4143 domain-containing protein [Bifidobacteriaceae bacterium]|jgi:predicted AAA+ superfamily ATPase|nr:DUF4143 domain-containing protein [Bifidobacteriaceae bacterium]
MSLADYLPRLVDAELTDLLSALPAVAIEGAKAVGKTRTAERMAATVFSLASRNVALDVEAGPEVISRAAQPVLVDEWQRLPWIWDEIRQWVDRDPNPGRFILTASAAPRGARVHSGAGRIVTIRMRPLSLVERGLDQPTVSLADLLSGQVSEVRGESGLALSDYVREIVGSGFPAIRAVPADYRARALDGYIEAVVAKEFPEQGLMVRKPESLLSWLRAYALATGSTAQYTTILDAATPGSGDKPSKSQTLVYRDTLASLWLIDPIAAWDPFGFGLEAPLTKSPKHYLADPALAARLLGLTEESVFAATEPEPVGIQGGSVLGRLFEALVALNLQVYAAAARARLGHLRTVSGQREVDFIAQRGNSLVALEVKLAPTPSDADVRHLNWLQDELPGQVKAKVCVTTGPRAYTRPDGVHVVPAVLLGP